MKTIELKPDKEQPEGDAAKTGMAPLDRLLDQARREARALAWSTGYPQLILPLLQAEKESTARAWYEKQARVFSATSTLLSLSLPPDRQAA